MKNKADINFKIAVHEAEINKLLEMDRKEWNDSHVELIHLYLRGRIALQWVLSDEDLVLPDEYQKQAEWECVCHESSNIF